MKNGTKIISNSKKYYIGKTKSFLFFYQPKEEITQIVPVSNVKNIELKKIAMHNITKRSIAKHLFGRYGQT